MRNRLRMSGDEFAQILHIDRSNLSKWENNHDRVGPQSDRLIRAIAVARVDGLKDKIDQVVNLFSRIQSVDAIVTIEIDTATWSYRYSQGPVATPPRQPQQAPRPIKAAALVRKRSTRSQAERAR